MAGSWQDRRFGRLSVFYGDRCCSLRVYISINRCQAVVLAARFNGRWGPVCIVQIRETSGIVSPLCQNTSAYAGINAASLYIKAVSTSSKEAGRVLF